MIDAKRFNEAMELCGTFCSRVGIKCTKIEVGYCEMECEITDKHLNPGGSAHGGMLFTLVDTAGCCAAGSVDGVEGRRTLVTQNASVFYLRPVLSGKLVAKARLIKSGRNVGLVTIDVFDERDRHVIRGELTAFYTSDVKDDIDEYFPRLKEVENR